MPSARADEAKTMTDGMSTQLKAISDAAAARATTAGAKPRVYYEIGYTDTTGQIYAPADKSFLAEMVTLAGAEPITTGDPNTYEIPLEKLIERDPQVIIIGVNPFYSPAPASLAKRPGWKVMTAIKDGAGARRQGHRDHPSGPAAGDRPARARARDLARPPAPAGVVGERRTCQPGSCPTRSERSASPAISAGARARSRSRRCWPSASPSSWASVSGRSGSDRPTASA